MIITTGCHLLFTCPSPFRVAPAELWKIEPSPAGAGKTWAPQHQGWTSLREGNAANVMEDDGWKSGH